MRAAVEERATHTPTYCGACQTKSCCLVGGLPDAIVSKFERLIRNGRRSPAHSVLYRQGEQLDHFFLLRSGSAKSCIVASEGSEHVTHFDLPGDLLGADAIATGTHGITTVLLEPSLVCSVSARQLNTLLDDCPPLRQRLERVLAGQLAGSYTRMAMLGHARAIERVSSFLLELDRRYARPGRPANLLRLPMARSDIANYLGLALATTSRQFAALKARGAIRNRGRTDIEILDHPALEAIAGNGRI